MALRVECSDPARNPYFPADFLSARFRCNQLPRNCVNITLQRFIGGRGESADQKKAQTISLNCGVTHSRGKIEYNCRYFLMTFRKRIRKNKFSKNDFHTLQGTMSHRPLTNTSSLKITAAYSTSTISRPHSHGIYNTSSLSLNPLWALSRHLMTLSRPLLALLRPHGFCSTHKDSSGALKASTSTFTANTKTHSAFRNALTAWTSTVA
jgi:hypothetical protein